MRFVIAGTSQSIIGGDFFNTLQLLPNKKEEVEEKIRLEIQEQRT